MLQWPPATTESGLDIKLAVTLVQRMRSATFDVVDFAQHHSDRIECHSLTQPHALGGKGGNYSDRLFWRHEACQSAFGID